MNTASENRRTKQARPEGKLSAFVTEACTGCGGAPVCVTFCRYDALTMVADNENYPFSKMVVDGLLCRGCGQCISNGINGVRLTGCPWDAIQLVRIFRDKGGA